MRLTAKAIAALSLPEGRADVIHFDDELSGFGYRLRRSPAGKVQHDLDCAIQARRR